MRDQIKIMCADFLEAKQEQERCSKEVKKLMDQIISITAGGELPHNEIIMKIEEELERTKIVNWLIDTRMQKMKAMSATDHMNQMAMQLKGGE